MKYWLRSALLIGAIAVLTISAKAETEFRQAKLTLAVDQDTQLGELYGPLSAADAGRYRRIFELQRDGDWRGADRQIAALGNDMLMGHVKAQRYLHPTAYRSKFGELRDWLQNYADHPQAATIYRLAMKRRPEGSESPMAPVKGFLGGSGQELIEERPTDYVSAGKRSVAQSREVEKWLRQIKSLVSRDRPTQATKLLHKAAAGIADPVERDLARWKISKGYFANQKDQQALDFAIDAAKTSGDVEPRIYWTAGLAAWRLGKFDLSARQFAALAGSDAPHEDRAAGAFWAARAFQALGQYERHQQYLRLAAEASDSFYGQLAQRITGASASFDWHEAGLRGQLRQLVGQFPATRRAMALAQAGQSGLAANEIRKLAARARPQLTQALAALAESLALPAAQMRVAQRLRLLDGRRHDGALYPLPPWEPIGGFKVDRALLYALARAESGFNPGARSRADARGLMQILPSTAKMVARKLGIGYRHQNQLFQPEVNLALGQAYVAQLLENRLIDGSLIHLAVAYNAGLKRLEDWDKRLEPFESDPLLFLESIPIPETRNYVRKVMANLWAYRARLEQDRVSLDVLANSGWPDYRPLDNGRSYARSN